jgi:hypothetical protein
MTVTEQLQKINLYFNRYLKMFNQNLLLGDHDQTNGVY